MKRRMKLFTSIASLSLAMAMVVFGVVAATARTATISGTVTFEASNLNATIVVQQGSAVANLAAVENGTLEYKVGDAAQLEKTATLSAALNDSVLTYVYRITITNTFAVGGSNIEVTLDDKFVEAAWITPENVEVDGTATTKSPTAATLAPGKTVIYTFSYTVDATKAPVQGNFPVGASLELVRAKAA